MVDFPLNTNIFRIADQITTPTAKNANVKWFNEDIKILTSNVNKGSTIVCDFSYDTAGIVEYTIDGGTTWIAFNNGVEVVGGQSRYVRVTSGVEFNLRSKVAGTLNRVIVGEV